MPNLRRIAATGLLGALLTLHALPTAAALNAGDTAPDFALQAALAGKTFTFRLKEALKTGPVVVYFYPSAYTNGCNVQAHTFAVNIEKFAAAGASVVGVSLDSIKRLGVFSADPDYCAGKIPVASDPTGSIAHAYALEVNERPGRKDTRGEEIDHAFVERTTFVVGRDGKIAATVGGLPPQGNVEKALEVIEGLRKHAGERP